MCSGCPSTAGSLVASLGHGPGEQADRQSGGRGRNAEHLALQITASREKASREHAVEPMRGCGDARCYRSIIGPPAMTAALGRHFIKNTLSPTSLTTDSGSMYLRLFILQKRKLRLSKDKKLGTDLGLLTPDPGGLMPLLLKVRCLDQQHRPTPGAY